MTPERKQHLRSLDASETPYLAEVLDALDVEEKRAPRLALAYDQAAKGWEEALARAEAAETAASTAWKRFDEMREAYKTNSRNYGGVVTAAERGREQAAKRTLGRSFVALALDGTLYALRHAAMTGTDAHLSSEAAGLVLGVVRAAMDRAVATDAALATYEDDLDAVTKFAAGDDVRR